MVAGSGNGSASAQRVASGARTAAPGRSPLGTRVNGFLPRTCGTNHVGAAGAVLHKVASENNSRCSPHRDVFARLPSMQMCRWQRGARQDGQQAHSGREQPRWVHAAKGGRRGTSRGMNGYFREHGIPRAPISCVAARIAATTRALKGTLGRQQAVVGEGWQPLLPRPRCRGRLRRRSRSHR